MLSRVGKSVKVLLGQSFISLIFFVKSNALLVCM